MKIRMKSLLLKTSACIFVLLVSFVAVVIFVNRKDQPPSKAAIDLRHVIDAEKPVADRDNAYVYMMGIAAADDADVMTAGLAQVVELRKFMATAGPLEMPKSPVEKGASAEEDDAELKKLATICKEKNQACAEEMQRDRARLQNWVKRYAVKINRYEALLEFRQWRELWPSDLRVQSAPFSHALGAQRLLHYKAWLMAGEGKYADSKDLLEKDLQFWRMVLAESSSLIVKMIAARGMEQNFAMGNLVIHQLPPEMVTKAVPDGWWVPISARERSMAKVFANEWMFMDRTVEQAKKRNEMQTTNVEEGPDAWTAAMLGSFLFHPQATSNASASRMLGMAELFDRDYAAIPAAAEKLLASEEFMQKAPTDVGIYNPVGNALLNLADMQTFSKYGFNVANVEGMRRMALLATQLRINRVNAEHVEEEILKSEFREPYDGKAFAWDKAQKSLVFNRKLTDKPDFKLLY